MPLSLGSCAGAGAWRVGFVREWHEEDRWGGVLDSKTPGGRWAHFSHLAMGGYRRALPGQRDAGHLPLNQLMATGPRPAALTRRPGSGTSPAIFTLILNTRSVVVFQTSYFVPPGLVNRTW